mgnify:CR=1 FL=1
MIYHLILGLDFYQCKINRDEHTSKSYPTSETIILFIVVDERC